MLVANVTTPFIAIEKVEAEQLGNAVADLMEIYGVPEMAPETIAWGSLIQACAFIYGTRIVAYRMEAAKRKREAAKPADAANSKGSLTPDPNAPKAPLVEQPLQAFTVQDIPGLGRVEVPMHP